MKKPIEIGPLDALDFIPLDSVISIISSAQLTRKLYDDLCSGRLKAIGDVEDCEGKHLRSRQEISASQWRDFVTPSDMRRAIEGGRLFNRKPFDLPGNAEWIINIRVNRPMVEQPATPRKRGRPHGSGTLGDEAVVTNARELLKNGQATSGTKAAQMALNDAGKKADESDIKRITRKMRKGEKGA